MYFKVTQDPEGKFWAVLGDLLYSENSQTGQLEAIGDLDVGYPSNAPEIVGLWLREATAEENRRREANYLAKMEAYRRLSEEDKILLEVKRPEW